MSNDAVISAADIVELFKSKGFTLSMAESCTGGTISSKITDIPGASSIFLGSVITYSNESKINILKVKKGTITKFGAVSAETAVEMSSGSMKLFGSDISLAVTGIAGPDGATEEKPVGLVFISVTDGSLTLCEEFGFNGSRQDVRNSSASKALEMLAFMVER